MGYYTYGERHYMVHGGLEEKEEEALQHVHHHHSSSRAHCVGEGCSLFVLSNPLLILLC